MASIKEVENLTGIDRQNIRYYEKEGLIHPKRNKMNAYRNYSQEDIQIIKQIILFRKLGVSIEEIRSLLEGKKQLSEILKNQKTKLKQEVKDLEAALKFCDKIKEENLSDLDVDYYLDEIKKEESLGSVFARVLDDYKKVRDSEQVRSFTFMPDNMCTTPAEFTESLCKYGDVEHLNLVVTKEGMTPHFTIDGIEYKAYRYSARYGMVVCCEAVNKEDYMPENMPEKKYTYYRRIRKILIAGGTCMFMCLPTLSYWDGKDKFIVLGLIFIGELSSLIYSYFAYGRNFKR